MASGSIRNIWDILNNVNTERNPLAGNDNDYAAAKITDAPTPEGADDVSKESEEPMGDNRRLLKSSDVTGTTETKSELSGIPSLDVIRTRLKLSGRVNNKKPSPRKQKDDLASSPKKTKTGTESQRAKWREWKKRQRTRNKSMPEDNGVSDGIPTAKRSRRSKKPVGTRNGPKNCDKTSSQDSESKDMIDDSESGDLNVNLKSPEFNQMSVALTRPSSTDSNGNILPVVAAQSGSGGTTASAKANNVNGESTGAERLPNECSTSPKAKSRVRELNLPQGIGVSRQDRARSTGKTSADSGPVPSGAIAADAGASREPDDGRPSSTPETGTTSSAAARSEERAGVVGDSEARSDGRLAPVTSETANERNAVVHGIRSPSPRTESNAWRESLADSAPGNECAMAGAQVQPADGGPPAPGRNFIPDLLLDVSEKSVLPGSGCSPADVDVSARSGRESIQMEAPLDLSKKTPSNETRALTSTAEMDRRRLGSPTRADDGPLDLSVKKDRQVAPDAGKSRLTSPIRAAREGETNKSAAIFEAFCLRPKQNRKVSPVRPHVRGKPVVLTSVIQAPLLIVDPKQTLPVIGAAPVSPLATLPTCEPDYSVFSVKHRITDMLKRKAARGAGTSGDVITDVNHNAARLPTTAVTVATNGAPLSTPSYRAKCRPLADPGGAATPILSCDGRVMRAVPTAHVKPNTLGGRREPSDPPRLAVAKPKPLRHSAELRKLLDQPPKVVVGSTERTSVDADGQGDAQPMPVLSPHGHLSDRDKDDPDVDITPPPPALVRQQTPPPIKLIPDLYPASETIVIDDDDDEDDHAPPGGERNASTPPPGPPPSTKTADVWSSSVFEPSVGKYGPARSFFSQHVAFAYRSERRRSKDIEQTKFYASAFGHSKPGGSLDAHSAHEMDVVDRSKRNALESAFPRIEFTDDWRRDMIRYKVKNLRIPEKLVRLPRRVPANFMQDVEKFIGGQSTGVAPKRPYVYLDTSVRRSPGDALMSSSSSSSSASEPEPVRPKRARPSGAGELPDRNQRLSGTVHDDMHLGRGLDEKRDTSRRGRDDMQLVELSGSDVLAALRTLFVPAGLKREVLMQQQRQQQQQQQQRQQQQQQQQQERRRQNAESVTRLQADGAKRTPGVAFVVRHSQATDTAALASSPRPIRTAASTTTTRLTSRPIDVPVRAASAGVWRGAPRSEKSGLRPKKPKSPRNCIENPETNASSEADVDKVNTLSPSRTRWSPRSPRSPRRYSPNCTRGSSQSPQQDNSAENSSHQDQHGTRSENVSTNSAKRQQQARDGSESYNAKRVKRGKKGRRPRSLLDELANTEGYVAEKRLSKTSESLLVDPSQLSREERALQRAIMKFSEMEFLRKNKAPSDAKMSQSAAKSSSRRKAGELKKKAINRHKAASGSHRHKFEDFKPIVLVARTRLQATSPQVNKRPTVPNQRSGRRHKRHTYKRRRKSRSPTRQAATSSHQSATSSHRSSSTPPATSERVTATSSSRTKSKRPSVSGRHVAPSSGQRADCRTVNGGGGRAERLTASPRRRRKQSWSGCFLFSDRGRKCRRAKCAKTTSGVCASSGTSSPRAVTMSDQIRARMALFESPRVQINRISDELAAGHSSGTIPLSSQSSDKQNMCSPTSSESQSVAGHVDDDAMSTCSNSQGDFNRHNIPPEVRRLNVCKETGETILHKAARMGYVDIVLWCCRTRYVDVNARDYAGFSALHETCISESVDTARCLLEHGADVNVASRLDGVRPLHDAIERDHFGLVRLFLSWGADPTLSTYSGHTALKIARTKQMRDFLMAYFVDLNGAFHMDKQTRWEIPFETKVGVSTSEYPYSDIFAGLPQDDDEEESSNIVFDMSDTDFLPCYCLTLEKGTRPSNYVLLADLLARLDISEEEFRERHRCIAIEKRCLSELDGPDVCQVRRSYRPYSHVSLVGYDENTKALLNVETVKLSRFDDVVRADVPRSSVGHATGKGRCHDKRRKQAGSKVNSGARALPPANGRAALKSPSWISSCRSALPKQPTAYTAAVGGSGKPAMFGVEVEKVGRRSRPEMMISLISGKTVLSSGMMPPLQRRYDVGRSVRNSESVATPLFVIRPEITVTTPTQNEGLICLLPDGGCENSTGRLTAVSGATAVSDLTADQCMSDLGFSEGSPEEGCGLKITKVCSLSETAAKQAFGPDL